MKIVCHETEEIVNNYNEYLKSKHWRGKRERYIKALKTCSCFICKINLQGKPFHVHHKTYKNIGKETFSDLVTVCPLCHKQIHDYHKLHSGLTLFDATYWLNPENKKLLIKIKPVIKRKQVKRWWWKTTAN